jgi:hypothetical protein
MIDYKLAVAVATDWLSVPKNSFIAGFLTGFLFFLTAFSLL